MMNHRESEVASDNATLFLNVDKWNISTLDRRPEAAAC